MIDRREHDQDVSIQSTHSALKLRQERLVDEHGLSVDVVE